jgi:DNA-binding NtrC family response regulator
MSGLNVIVLHEDKDIRKMWAQRLTRAGFAVEEAASVVKVLPDRGTLETALVVYGQPAVGSDPFELVSKLLNSRPRTAIIFVATHGSEQLAIRALRAGVTDYIRDPLDTEELVASVTRIFGRMPQASASPLPGELPGDSSTQMEETLKRPLIGESAAMREAKSRLLRAAAVDSNVLITGETGTGKELAAQLIHHASSRKEKPLLSVNCAAIPETLLESELFGHERGAFTDAQWANAGLLERADGGTLFLDEVGEMSPVAQAKVLRVIETKELSRLGGRKTLRVNVRFVAATNQNIDNLIKEHRFRSDLYFRLNVLRVHLPLLRERKEDLPALISYYVQEFNRLFGRNVEGFSNASYQRLLAYDWPGNVREVRNLLEATFVNETTEKTTHIDLPTEWAVHDYCHGGIPERDQLLSALLSTKWNKSEAARQLKWSRMTLYRKMVKHDLRDTRPQQSTHAA